MQGTSGNARGAPETASPPPPGPARGLVVTLALVVCLVGAMVCLLTPRAGAVGWDAGAAPGQVPRERTEWRAALPHIEVATATLALPPLPGWIRALQDAGAAMPGAAEYGGVGATPNGASPVVITQTAPARVYLGDSLYYTLVMTNNSPFAADVEVQDILPIPSQDQDVWCEPECGRSSEVVTVTIAVPTQYGGSPYIRVVTTTHWVDWQSVELAPGATWQAQFAIVINGRDDGMILTNRSYVRYRLANGSSGTTMSNETATAVQIYSPPGIGLNVSSAPAWNSDDQGGTGSLDWGDFDRDGYLDLVVGGSGSTAVYRNENGRLTPFWNNDRYAHDVHWADFDGDGLLEIAAIGYDWWVGQVHNRVYHLSPDGGRFVDVAADALEGQKLLRAAPADYDADGDLDLIAATYRRWTLDGCTFRAYPNTSGVFTTTYHCLADPYRDYQKTTEDFLSLADVDNDDDLDLVLDVYQTINPVPGVPCPYQDLLWVALNQDGAFTATVPVTVDVFDDCAWPASAAWGDMDRDGDLDAAVAVPTLTGMADHQVRIYRNSWIESAATAVSFVPVYTLALPFDQPAYAVEWADLDGDGDLDLAAAGSPFRIFLNEQGVFSDTYFIAPPAGQDDPDRAPAVVSGGNAWFALDLGAGDYDRDGDLDLAVGNAYEPSALYPVFASRLSPVLTPIASRSGESVAWGDVDANGSLDLLFGASASTVDALLFFNEGGVFPDSDRFPSSGFGPHTAAFGDVDGDGVLDLALGTPAGTQVYLAGNRNLPNWTSPAYLASTALAWGDADDDRDLDLFVATAGLDSLFLNENGVLESSASWTSAGEDDSRSVAWGDLDGDFYLDVAVGNRAEPSRVYGNNQDGTFHLAWTSSQGLTTTTVAWADYDGDGDLDLTLGNYGQPNLIYENLNGTLEAEPAWTSAEVSRTTSVAWGDWDNDGDLDLAVGNDGQRDQVYVNRLTPLAQRTGDAGSPRLLWLWSSADALATTALAWGDQDGDGDLDLAMSSLGKLGVYENHDVTPSHLDDDFVPTLALPNNPSYAAVDRPGSTAAANFYSSEEVLSGPLHPTVTVEYRLFDPDATRAGDGVNEPGDPIPLTLFDFSLDGGGTWQPATAAAGAGEPVTTTCRLGQPGTFVWDAVADQAISDLALFRITIVPQQRSGPVQRAATSATSPPFRVRGTSCIWPRGPRIGLSNNHPAIGEPVRLVGSVIEGSGMLTYTWDFGDGSSDQGQVVYHTYPSNGRYLITMRVRSEPCPIAKEVTAMTWIGVGTGQPNIYLPLTRRSGN